MKIDQSNNTKETQKFVFELVSSSPAWIVFRFDKKGNTHFHMPNIEHIMPLVSFLSNRNEISDLVLKQVNEIRRADEN